MILSVLRAPVEPHAESKVGIIVSRKVGGAVVRNRLKRRCKELHRLSRSYIACGLWIVMILKREAATSSFADLQTEWLRLARKLSILTRS
jgi:ribonuclease P protein component